MANDIQHRLHRLAWVCVAITLLTAAGCTTLRPSIPAPKMHAAANSCIRVIPALPSMQLPSDAVPFPKSAYVLVPATSAAGLLMPIPFVSDLVSGTINRSDAKDYQGQLGGLNPMQAAQRALGQPPFASICAATDAPQLHSFVFLVEGHDNQYRLTLVFQLQQGAWIGRYQEHLPTTIPKESLRAISPALLNQLRQEMESGAQLLASLLLEDLQGRLPATGAKVDIGSLYLIGSNVAGLIAPEHLHFRDTELISEQGDELLMRRSGSMTAPGQSGALLFGVHHFRKDQLFYFRRQ
ncbi:hypothetical protein ACJJWD_06485 [Comamonas testosteroni]